MLDLTPLLRRRRRVIALAVLTALAAAPGVARLELDASPRTLSAEDDRALAGHRRRVAAFGSSRAVQVVVSGAALWSRRGVAWLGELERRLNAVPGVLAAAGPRWWSEAEGRGWPPADAAALRARAIADPLARGAGWVSADGSRAGVAVALARVPARGAEGSLAAVEALAATSPPGIVAQVVGLPVVRRALESDVAAMMARFFPALALALLAALTLLFRRARQVMAVAGLVALPPIATLGAMGWSGAALDPVTCLLVPLLTVVATATGVHLLMRWRALGRRRDAREAARELVAQKGWPVAWSGVTTAAGFASLAVAPVPAVRALGIWAAFGLLVLTLGALTVLPCLLAGNRRSGPGGRWAATAGRLGRRWATAAVARRRAVVAVFASVALVALAGTLRLRPADDPLALLAGDHPLRTSLAALEAVGMGTATADLVLTLPRGRGEGFDAPPRLARLRDLAARLSRLPLARGAVAAGDLVRTSRGSPATQPNRLLPAFLTADGRRTRIALSLPMTAGVAVDRLFAAARAEAAALFPRAAVDLTGAYPLALRTQRTLLRTMLISLAVAAALLGALLVPLLGGVSLAARALAANLWPVLVALGALGWSGLPLGSATVAVAAVVLGLAMDDTLHTLADFRRLAPRRGPRRAAVAAIGVNAAAHVSTSLLLAGGFALFGLSGFVPGARFGLLMAVAVLAALAADLLLVPALLAGLPPAAAGRRQRA